MRVANSYKIVKTCDCNPHVDLRKPLSTSDGGSSFPYKFVIELENLFSLHFCKDFSFNIFNINKGFSPELLPATFSNKVANNSEVPCVAGVENGRIVADSLRLRQSGYKNTNNIHRDLQGRKLDARVLKNQDVWLICNFCILLFIK